MTTTPREQYDEYSRKLALRNMMRECDTITQAKSIISQAETADEIHTLASIKDNEQLYMYVDALVAKLS